MYYGGVSKVNEDENEDEEFVTKRAGSCELRFFEYLSIEKEQTKNSL